MSTTCCVRTCPTAPNICSTAPTWARRREAPRIPANGDASIAIIGDPTAGTIRIAVHNAKTEMLEAGRYFDALQVTIGDVASPLWLGQILVAANPRRAMLPP